MNILVFADRNSPGSTWGKLGVSVTVIDYVHIFNLSNLVVFDVRTNIRPKMTLRSHRLKLNLKTPVKSFRGTHDYFWAKT